MFPLRTVHVTVVQSVIILTTSRLAWIQFPAEAGIFLFATASILALGPTQLLSIHWMPGTLSREAKWGERETDHSFPSSAEVIRGDTLPLPHTFTWHRIRLHGQFYLYGFIICSNKFIGVITSSKKIQFSLHHRVQNGFVAHPASYPLGTRGCFAGVKAAGAWS